MELGERLQHLLFEITDTGIGIAAEDQDRVFQPFVQLGSKRRHRAGLAITRQYVQLLGGSISVSSEPGQGSTFRFSIGCEPVDPQGVLALPVSKGIVMGFENARDFGFSLLKIRWKTGCCCAICSCLLGLKCAKRWMAAKESKFLSSGSHT